jgi:hypothetical protein
VRRDRYWAPIDSPSRRLRARRLRMSRAVWAIPGERLRKGSEAPLRA